MFPCIFIENYNILTDYSWRSRNNIIHIYKTATFQQYTWNYTDKNAFLLKNRSVKEHLYQRLFNCCTYFNVQKMFFVYTLKNNGLVLFIEDAVLVLMLA